MGFIIVLMIIITILYCIAKFEEGRGKVEMRSRMKEQSILQAELLEEIRKQNNNNNK